MIVSADPAQKGISGKWLVRFDGETKNVPRTRQQLQFDKDSSTRTTEQLEHGEEESETSSNASEDDNWFVAQDSNDLESLDSTQLDLDGDGDSCEEEQEVPDDVSIDDIKEWDYDVEDIFNNPYVPNTTDIENDQVHQRKWNSYIEKKKKLIETAHTITVIPSRTAKVKVGDQIKWVSYILQYFFI